MPNKDGTGPDPNCPNRSSGQGQDGKGCKQCDQDQSSGKDKCCDKDKDNSDDS